jgi:hypothetical protein
LSIGVSPAFRLTISGSNEGRNKTIFPPDAKPWP